MTWRRCLRTFGIAAGLLSPHAAHSDFAGLYFGSHIGGNFPAFEIEGDFDNPDATSYDLNPDAWTAGLQAGYNLPYAGFILGIEGAVSFGSEVDTRAVIVPDSGDSRDDVASYVFKDTITLAARIGVPVTPDIIPFAKFGVAWADVEGIAADTDGVPPVLDSTDLTTIDGWETGYVVGGGVEYQWAPNWSIKAEYEYMDFGSITTGNIDGDTITHDVSNHAIKAGMNYHF